MSDPDDTQPVPAARPARKGAPLVNLGVALVGAAVVGFLTLTLFDSSERRGETAAVSTATLQAAPQPSASPAPSSLAPTALPEPTRIPPPAFAGSTETPAQAAGAVSPSTFQPEAATATFSMQPTIYWTQEETYALQWTCYSEIGGMGSVKIDACYSVISTIRARYAYESSPFPERDVIGTLLRPNQFYGTWYTDRPGPDPDLNWAVEQYRLGARGSCNGYYFFDSVPGGPSLCVIYGAGGQFMEFHNGWN